MQQILITLQTFFYIKHFVWRQQNEINENKLSKTIFKKCCKMDHFTSHVNFPKTSKKSAILYRNLFVDNLVVNISVSAEKYHTESSNRDKNQKKLGSCIFYAFWNKTLVSRNIFVKATVVIVQTNTNTVKIQFSKQSGIWIPLKKFFFHKQHNNFQNSRLEIHCN